MKRLKGKNISILLVMALVFVIRIPQWFLPARFDVSAFGYLSWMMSLGEVPYRDFFLGRTPIMLFINSLFMRLFGTSLYTALLVETCVVVLSVFILYKIVSNISDDHWLSLGSAVVFAVYASKYSISAGGGATEHYENLFYLLGLWILTKSDWKKPEASTLLLFGMAIGCASLVRQLGLIPVFAWGLFFIFIPWLEISRGRAFIFYSLGCIGVFAVFGIYLIATGSFGDFLTMNLVHNISYAREGLWEKTWISGNIHLLFKFIKETMPILPFAFVGIFQLSSRWSLLILALVASIFEGFALGYSSHMHYAIVMLPWASVVAALGMKTIYDWAVPKGDKRKGKIVLTLLSLLVILQPGLISPSQISFLKKRLVSDLKEQRSFMAENYGSYKVAEIVKNKLAEDQSFGYWGWGRTIPLVAQRRVLSRSLFFQSLIYDIPDDFRIAEEKLFVSEIEYNMPIIVVVSIRNSLKFPEPPNILKSFLNSHYNLIQTIGPWQKSVSGFRGNNGSIFQIWELIGIPD